jgi:hypothetical protein
MDSGVLPHNPKKQTVRLTPSLSLESLGLAQGKFSLGEVISAGVKQGLMVCPPEAVVALVIDGQARPIDPMFCEMNYDKCHAAMVDVSVPYTSSTHHNYHRDCILGIRVDGYEGVRLMTTRVWDSSWHRESERGRRKHFSPTDRFVFAYC